MSAVTCWIAKQDIWYLLSQFFLAKTLLFPGAEKIILISSQNPLPYQQFEYCQFNCNYNFLAALEQYVFKPDSTNFEWFLSQIFFFLCTQSDFYFQENSFFCVFSTAANPKAKRPTILHVKMIILRRICWGFFSFFLYLIKSQL